MEIFCWAGSSALLLSVVRLYPELWYLSAIALVPFLWAVTKRSLSASCLTASLVATTFVLVTHPTGSLPSPSAFPLTLFLLNVVFCLYAAAVNLVKRPFGFHAVLMAILWLSLEYALHELVPTTALFTNVVPDSDLLSRVGWLFGLLMVSLLIVLLNSLVLSIVRRFVRTDLLSAKTVTEADRLGAIDVIQKAAKTKPYFLPGRRAPPHLSYREKAPSHHTKQQVSSLNQTRRNKR